MLSFYTDGLIETRERDVDASHQLLCDALATYSDSLDETCDRVLHALLPTGGALDDVALLLARTRGLPASQVATWDIPRTRPWSRPSASRPWSSWTPGGCRKRPSPPSWW